MDTTDDFETEAPTGPAMSFALLSQPDLVEMGSVIDFEPPEADLALFLEVEAETGSVVGSEMDVAVEAEADMGSVAYSGVEAGVDMGSVAYSEVVVGRDFGCDFERDYSGDYD